MSRLDQLISQYCPAGVPMVRLGEVEDRKILQMGRGNVISKEDILNTPGDYPVYSSSSQNNGMIGCYGKYMFDDERITWSIDGGGRMFYRNGHRYSVTNVCGWIKVLRSNELSTKYLYYALYNAWINIVFDYNHKAHPSVIRNEYFIPLPPLPVQEEIVRILDAMSDLVTNLDAEISARQKQYEHAREKLLTFGEEVERKTLGEVGEMIKGSGIMKSDFVDAGKPCIHYGQIHTYYKTSAFKTKSYISEALFAKSKYAVHGDLVIATTSEDVEACCKACAWLGDEPVAVSGDAHIFHHTQNAKYMSYLFQTEQFATQKRLAATGAKVVRVSGNSILQFEFPLPSLSVQQSIVERLDKMESLIRNLQAERALRQKQYEYYREKLLTF